MKLPYTLAAILLIATKIVAFAPTTFRKAIGTSLATSINRTVKDTAIEPNERITDYMHRVAELSSMLNACTSQMAEVKDAMIELKNLQLSDPSLPSLSCTLTSKRAYFKNALAEVKAAVDCFGPNSREAKMAWDYLNDVDLQQTEVDAGHPSYRYNSKAVHSHHKYDAVVDTEMLSEAIQALETIESVAHFVNKENDLLYRFIWKNYQAELAP